MADSQEPGSGGGTQAADEPAARRRRLQSYLPSKVVDAFRDAGVTRDLYQWQARPAAASRLRVLNLFVTRASRATCTSGRRGPRPPPVLGF